MGTRERECSAILITNKKIQEAKVDGKDMILTSTLEPHQSQSGKERTRAGSHKILIKLTRL